MYENNTLEELKEKCRVRNLPVSGRKIELIERLRGNRNSSGSTNSYQTAFEDAYKFQVSPITGGWSNKFQAVRTKLRNHTRNGTEIWVGITSGGIEGCKSRWNHTYKHKEGRLNRMMSLYETASEEFQRNMETELTDLIRNLENVRRGGAGRRGGPSPYVVYCCWKE